MTQCFSSRSRRSAPKDPYADDLFGRQRPRSAKAAAGSASRVSRGGIVDVEAEEAADALLAAGLASGTGSEADAADNRPAAAVLDVLRSALRSRRRIEDGRAAKLAPGGKAGGGAVTPEMAALLCAARQCGITGLGFGGPDASRIALSSGQLRTLCGALGVSVGAAEARAVMRRVGTTAGGLMPLEVFAAAVAAGGAKYSAMTGTERGPYDPKSLPDSFEKKVVYAPSKTGVYAPTHFQAAMAARSASPPAAKLELEFVHGYSGLHNTAPNLFFTAREGEFVYYTAGVGIVCTTADAGGGERMAQCFFRGHTDDIRSLAIHPNRSLVATGQLGHTPTVCVWDSADCQMLVELEHEPVRGSTSRLRLCFERAAYQGAIISKQRKLAAYRRV